MRDWKKRPLTGSEHVAADIRAGRFPKRSTKAQAKREIEQRENSENRAGDIVSLHGVRHAFIGLSYGALALKWGPYPPDVVGAFMSRLLDVDPERKLPVFFSVELDAVDDPIEAILDWTREAPADEG